MRRTTSQLDRLLSGKDQLSPSEKERVLERVLARVAAAEPRPATQLPRFPRWAVAVAVLVLAAPAAWVVWKARTGPEFTVRGGSDPAPALRLRCTAERGQPGPCVRGGRLLFDIVPGQYRAFAAVALAPDGETLWYFPNDSLPTGVALDPAGRPGLLSEAITLDDRHPVGAYVIYGVFSPAPLTQNQVRQALRGRAGDAVAVVKQELRVGERSP